jgi:ribosome-interacting GTPase 1
LQLESIQNHIKEIEEVKEAIQSNVNTKLAMEVLRERLAS